MPHTWGGALPPPDQRYVECPGFPHWELTGGAEAPGVSRGASASRLRPRRPPSGQNTSTFAPPAPTFRAEHVHKMEENPPPQTQDIVEHTFYSTTFPPPASMCR